jgi:hypothetical protein
MQNKHKKVLTNVFSLLIIAIETQSDATKCEEVTKMLTRNEQKTLERLETVMQSMDEMQKAQLCAFAEGLAMALEHSKRAS